MESGDRESRAGERSRVARGEGYTCGCLLETAWLLTSYIRKQFYVVRIECRPSSASSDCGGKLVLNVVASSR